jgi:hypothetical protein
VFILRLQVALNESKSLFEAVEPTALSGSNILDDERQTGLTPAGPLDAQNKVAPMDPTVAWIRRHGDGPPP